MVRRLSSFLLMIMILGIAMTSNEAIYAKDTSVQYSPEQNTYYQTKIIVIGKGRVMDGMQTIGQGQTIFELLPGTKKEFSLIPDPGYELKSVIIDGSNTKIEHDRFLTQQKNQHMLIVITFQKAGQIQPPQPETQDPVWPDQPTEEPIQTPIEEEKEIISIIIKDIMIDDMGQKDILDIIRNHIISTKPYKILSHNVQRKPGIYEVVIQFEDGTIKVLHITVTSEKEVNRNSKVIHPQPCYIHWLIALITLIYLHLGLRGTYLRHQLIQSYRHQNYDKDATELDQMKKKSVLAVLTSLGITCLYVMGKCPWDLMSYLVCSLFILISMLHTH